jgi:ABC-2 type transport system ATP-binding protein
MNAISIKNLNFKFSKNKILNDISFEIPSKKICAFIGNNGAGKTTTINAILNLYKTKSNTKIFINGICHRLPQSRCKLGFAPEYFTFGKITVKDLLLIVFNLKNNDGKLNFENEINKLFKYMHCPKNLLAKKLNVLSSGVRKIVNIIQSLLCNPNLVIMDEPTSNIDPQNRRYFYETIRKFHKSGTTFFISTHNLSEIRDFANWFVIIDNGNLLYSGSKDKCPAKLFHEYFYTKSTL